MQSQEQIRLDQTSPDEGGDSGSAATAEPAPIVAKKKAAKKKAAKKKVAKKKASKKKASKKKTGKKKATKKKATKKKASKKKASKKKAGKKKRAVSGGDSMSRLIAAVEELRAAVVELAGSELNHRRQAVEDLRASARAKIADLETAAQHSLARFTGKG